MAIISTLAVSITARTTALEKGLRRGRRSLRKFAKGVPLLNKNLAAIGATAGVAAAAGITYLTARSMKAIDATAKWADRLGVSTEQLAGLQHAAQRTGTPVQALNVGLQRMTRRVAEAAMGTGEARGALQELGLDAAMLAGKSPDQAFLDIADAINQIPNNNDRVRLTFKLFDSEGVALVNTMRGGREAVEALIAEYDKLGGSFSRLDAAKVEAANDSMANLRVAISGAGKVLAIQLAPIITAVTRRFLDMATAGEGIGGKVATGMEIVVKVIGRALDVLNWFKAGWYGIAGVVQAVLGGIATYVTFVANGWITAFNLAAKGIELAMKGIGVVVTFMVNSWIGQINIVIKALRTALRGASKLASSLGQEKLSKKLLKASDINEIEPLAKRLFEGLEAPKLKKIGNIIGEAALEASKESFEKAALFGIKGAGKTASKGLEKFLTQLREQADREAALAVGKGAAAGIEPVTAAAKRKDVPRTAAVLRGSVEAFQATRETFGKEDKQLEEQKKTTEAVDELKAEFRLGIDRLVHQLEPEAI